MTGRETLALVGPFAAPSRAQAQGVLLKDIANVQGVTANQLIGYGLVVGLNQTGDSTSVLFTSKTIQNIRGESYYWGLRGTRTGGDVALDQGVTAKGPNSVRVPLGNLAAIYYPWIALLILFLITSFASKGNLRFMVILVPVMAAMFWWFGWLSGTYLAAVIPFSCLLGGVYFMKPENRVKACVTIILWPRSLRNRNGILGFLEHNTSLCEKCPKQF